MSRADRLQCRDAHLEIREQDIDLPSHAAEDQQSHGNCCFQHIWHVLSRLGL